MPSIRNRPAGHRSVLSRSFRSVLQKSRNWRSSASNSSYLQSLLRRSWICRTRRALGPTKPIEWLAASGRTDYLARRRCTSGRSGKSAAAGWNTPGHTGQLDERPPQKKEAGKPPGRSVQIEQKSYEMPPRDGFTVTHFITVADIDRSADFYEKVFGGRILSRGDTKGASGHIQIANIWLIVNVGGGPTPDKPSVTLSVPADPDKVSSFLNIRVADIQACYELWKSRGAEFITEPKEKYGEIRCYIRDPDGYIIEVGQSTDVT